MVWYRERGRNSDTTRVECTITRRSVLSYTLVQQSPSPAPHTFDNVCRLWGWTVGKGLYCRVPTIAILTNNTASFTRSKNTACVVIFSYWFAQLLVRQGGQRNSLMNESLFSHHESTTRHSIIHSSICSRVDRTRFKKRLSAHTIHTVTCSSLTSNVC